MSTVGKYTQRDLLLLIIVVSVAGPREIFIWYPANNITETRNHLYGTLMKKTFNLMTFKIGLDNLNLSTVI